HRVVGRRDRLAEGQPDLGGRFGELLLGPRRHLEQRRVRGRGRGGEQQQTPCRGEQRERPGNRTRGDGGSCSESTHGASLAARGSCAGPGPHQGAGAARRGGSPADPGRSTGVTLGTSACCISSAGSCRLQRTSGTGGTGWGRTMG